MIDYFRCEKLGVAGYVAVRKPTEELIVSFRGSDSFANWLYNLYISLDRVPWIYTVYQPEETAKVHEGFLLSYESVRREVLSHVSSAVEEYPGYSVKVIGHSLGGALANLCALDLRGVLSQEVAVRLMTYESPRVGDANFARLMRYQFPNALDRLRVTNGHDIVVHMPPYDLDYHHAAQEVFIPPDAHEQTLAYACDAENGEDPRCADAYLGCSVDDHLYIPWGLDFGSTCNGMGPSYPSSCD
jgi:predicted lipase